MCVITLLQSSRSVCHTCCSCSSAVSNNMMYRRTSQEDLACLPLLWPDVWMERALTFSTKVSKLTGCTTSTPPCPARVGGQFNCQHRLCSSAVLNSVSGVMYLCATPRLSVWRDCCPGDKNVFFCTSDGPVSAYAGY